MHNVFLNGHRINEYTLKPIINFLLSEIVSSMLVISNASPIVYFMLTCHKLKIL